MALAVQAYLPQSAVCLWGRRDQAVADARDSGVKEASADLAESVRGADLIILASPVGAMAQILTAVAAESDLSGVLITDVGSVKVAPLDQLRKITQETGAIYIGSHPMAGSEQAGIRAAKADLFQGAACVITPDLDDSLALQEQNYEEHYEERVSQLMSFWESIGCRCHRTSAIQHDEVMARISHLPHMLASVGALVGLRYPDFAELAGNGLRDTTRVASGHPAMWAEIMLSNRDAMKAPIEESIKHLREMLALLENSSEEELTDVLDQAKQLRDQLS